MRNGHVNGGNLRIGVSTLGMQDKLRLQAVLLDKLGLSSTINKRYDALNIHELSK